MLAAKEDLLAAYEGEIAELRAQIKAAHVATSGIGLHDYSEAQTGDLYIDVLWGSDGLLLDILHAFKQHALATEVA